MSDAKIQELDRQVEMQQQTTNRVLTAIEKQTLSMEKLSESVTQMTTRFDYLTDEVKEFKGEFKEVKNTVRRNETDVAVMKRGAKWQEWAERAVVMAIIGGILWAMKHH